MVLKPKRQLWIPSKPAIIVPNRRPVPVVRPPIIPARRIIQPRAAVALDATGTEGAFTTAATSHNYTGLTIGASLTNGAAVFGVWVEPSAGGGAGGTISATWNGATCTNIVQLNTAGSVGSLALFGIVNPASGNQTLAVTTVNSCEAAIIGVSFSGVLQTGGTTTFAHSASVDHTSSNINSQTLSITTANGDYTFCLGIYGQDGTGAGLSPGQFFADNSGGTGNFGGSLGTFPCGAKNAETTSPRVYTISNQGISTDIIAAVGLDIVAAAAGTVVEEDNSRVPRQYWSGWTPNALLLRNTAQDFSSSAVETNPHWRPWTFPPQWLKTGRLLQDAALDVPVVVTPDTPPPFRPSTWPVQWVRTWQLLQNTAQDFSSSAVETNVHTIFKTWPVQWLPTKGLLLNTDTVAPVPQPETNVHTVFKTWSAQWVPLAALQRVPPTDVPLPIQPETNVHFIPRTWPPQWVKLPALRYNTAQDFSSSAVETNVHFIPRTWPPQWALQASLMRGTAQDFSTTPPATNPVYARYGAGVGFGSTWAIPGEIPS